MTMNTFELKALAIELAAAMPPTYCVACGQPADRSRTAALAGPRTASAPDREEVTDALARLVQAECTLRVLSAWLTENTTGHTEWQASETLDGALALLSGCHEVLCAIPLPAPAAEAAA